MEARRIVLLSACLLSSCLPQKMLRQHSKVQEQYLQQSVHTDSRNLDIHKEQLWLSTADHTLQAELIPEGTFRYSPEQGFEGRASVIRIRQRQQSLNQFRDSSSLRLAQQEKKLSAASGQSKTQFREQQRSFRTGQIWLIPATGVLCLLAGFVFGHRRGR